LYFKAFICNIEFIQLAAIHTKKGQVRKLLKEELIIDVMQWFSTMFLELPNRADMICFPNQTHLFSSSVETQRLKIGMLEKRRLQIADKNR